MKKEIVPQGLLVVIFSVMFSSLAGQPSSGKVQSEIKETLTAWNTACKNADLDKVMSMLNNTDDIMVVGSADGEISRGRDEVKKWLTQIFGFAGFSWEMNRVEIDSNGKTAWVFVDGKMIVGFHKGGTKVTPYRFTGVLVKEKGVWKWSLFNGSVPQQE
jgi:ketosteroid isomerase-like protein